MAESFGTHKIPSLKIGVVSFKGDLDCIFPKPIGTVESEWPPIQVSYLSHYLNELNCKTVLVESHYIDRDYIDDVALFYAKSLRSYPNHCQRAHFFSDSFSQADWDEWLMRANNGQYHEIEQRLQNGYVGFAVIRPLPGAPVGRTVLKTFGEKASDGRLRNYSAVRKYVANLAGFALRVQGLAFQQQDRGVSACATTALWCAAHQMAHMEGIRIPTPAEITQAASRYFLPGGRALPSEGLTIEQLCEAIRATGLAPLYIPAQTFEGDRKQLLAYLASGFAPVLAIQRLGSEAGHAVCAVGLRIKEVDPQTDPSLSFRDGATALCGLYIHDDRLGPYASADILPLTVGKKIKTMLRIRWPRTQDEFENCELKAIVVPVASKLRLTADRLWDLGMSFGEAFSKLCPQFGREVTVSCRYISAVQYRKSAFTLGLEDTGAHRLAAELVMSRYLGVVELVTTKGPLLDVILDTTETNANPAILALVRK